MISVDNVIITESEIPDIFYGLMEKAKESPDYNDYADKLNDEDIGQTLYELQMMAENRYNADGWRQLFALISLASYNNFD